MSYRRYIAGTHPFGQGLSLVIFDHGDGTYSVLEKAGAVAARYIAERKTVDEVRALAAGQHVIRVINAW